jgi:hypothetical protein
MERRVRSIVTNTDMERRVCSIVTNTQMLWYKGWLETRWRLIIAFGWIAWFLIAEYSRGTKGPAGVAALSSGAMIIAVVIPMFFVGAGIATQPAFRMAKGLQGSTVFTLSLPVSRFRLLATRACLGWLVLAAAIGIMCCGMWVLFPVLRAATTGVKMLEYAGSLLVCGSGLYAIGVLLATFLEEQWRLWGNILVIGALWWLSDKMAPAYANIFRAMNDGSPLIAHTVPWTAMGVSLGLAAILFVAALKVVQTREY